MCGNIHLPEKLRTGISKNATKNNHTPLTQTGASGIPSATNARSIPKLSKLPATIHGRTHLKNHHSNNGAYQSRAELRMVSISARAAVHFSLGPAIVTSIIDNDKASPPNLIEIRLGCHEDI